jgi:two-component system OmpR family sensor kinase
LQHTPPEAAISVEAVVAGARAAIVVRDTGPGIAPEALAHVFERFYRADAARSGSSTGLGLAIAKTLVEAQQGTIDVESEVGKGSKFTVSLPAAAEAARPRQSATSRRSTSPAGACEPPLLGS